jgi:hypothetical protein
MYSKDAIRILLRRDTTDNWKKTKNILLEGEPSFDTKTGILKIGNGKSLWKDLPSINTLPMNDNIKIGKNAGKFAQHPTGISIGAEAGNESQCENSIAIGVRSGNDSQGENGICIGTDAGFLTQERDAIAIGTSAGFNCQGEKAIAIGFRAGVSAQHDNSIILNATNEELNSAQKSSLFVAPIRKIQKQPQAPYYQLYYNIETNEIVYYAP